MMKTGTGVSSFWAVESGARQSARMTRMKMRRMNTLYVRRTRRLETAAGGEATGCPAAGCFFLLREAWRAVMMRRGFTVKIF